MKVFVSGYLTGIIFNDGPIWKDLRRVTMTTMREFGVGKKSLEKRVQEEAHAIMDILDKCQGQEVNMRPLLAKCTSNIICSIIFGSRYVTLEKIRWKNRIISLYLNVEVVYILLLLLLLLLNSHKMGFTIAREYKTIMFTFVSDLNMTIRNLLTCCYWLMNQ